MPSSFKQDYTVFLKDSGLLVTELKALQKLRNVLKKSPSTKIPEDDEYYKKLNARIMSQVGQRPQFPLWRKLISSKNLHVGIAFFALTASLIFTFSNLKKKVVEDVLSHSLKTDLLFATSAKNLESYLNSGAAMDNSEEALFDLAAQRLDTLDEGDAQKAISQLME